MKRCWDQNPDNRPNAIELKELIKSFRYSDDKIIKQFEEVYKHKKASLSFNQLTSTHPHAIYTF